MEENSPTQQEQDPNQLNERVKQMLTIEKRKPEEVVAQLVSEGVDQDSAMKLVNYAQGGTGGSSDEEDMHYEEEDSGSGVADMAIGAVVCIGGIVATAADIGYIFYGAIIYGGIKFFAGLVKTLS